MKLTSESSQERLRTEAISSLTFIDHDSHRKYKMTNEPSAHDLELVRIGNIVVADCCRKRNLLRQFLACPRNKSFQLSCYVQTGANIAKDISWVQCT